MNKRNVSMILISGVLILAIALGATAVFAQIDEDPDTPTDAEEREPFHRWYKDGWSLGQKYHSNPKGLTSDDELLADELGVSAEELKGAFTAAIEAAREDGVFDFKGPRAFDGDSEFESYLADALADIDLTIDELDAAKEAVKAIKLAELVEEGYLTEDQLSMIEAREALKEYIDRQALMAAAAEDLDIEFVYHQC